MSQLVEPVEVTWKRAAAIWWNFTWRQLAVFVIIGFLNWLLDAWVSNMDDGTFYKSCGVLFGIRIVRVVFSDELCDHP